MIGSLVLKKNLSTIWEIEKWDDLYKLVQKYFWDIGKEEKSVSQLFLENLVTEKSVSQIVKFGVILELFIVEPVWVGGFLWNQLTPVCSAL